MSLLHYVVAQRQGQPKQERESVETDRDCVCMSLVRVFLPSLGVTLASISSKVLSNTHALTVV